MHEPASDRVQSNLLTEWNWKCLFQFGMGLCVYYYRLLGLMLFQCVNRLFLVFVQVDYIFFSSYYFCLFFLWHCNLFHTLSTLISYNVYIYSILFFKILKWIFFDKIWKWFLNEILMCYSSPDLLLNGVYRYMYFCYL